MTARLAAQTTEKVDGGTSKAADKTARALDKVVKGTKEIGAMVDRISRSSVRQAESIIQIGQSMEMVSGDCTGNSATAERKRRFQRRTVGAGTGIEKISGGI